MFFKKDSNCHIYAASFLPKKQDLSVLTASSNPNFVSLLESKKDNSLSHRPSWEIKGFEKGVYSLSVDNTERYLAAGCGDNHVSIFNLN